jgi:putative alpha-1,2-mannosidase
MRESRITAALLSVLIACSPAFAKAGAELGPASWVNPLIGATNGGNVFPGAVVPFGMVQFSPETSPLNSKVVYCRAGWVRVQVGQDSWI